ncbi:hypothetical protein [Vulcanisaeta thermophila]|uniref:hypothetical protein n=1 Tax=Vulcanisaeta thermophila TaxID=867917 RepID=UPI00085304D1|nr:hypothetical protein [Vulcanisaeta thermophila]
MRLPRRFPRDVAERRLEEIIELGRLNGNNVIWVSNDEFVIRDWGRHVRFKAVPTGDEYRLVIYEL